MTTNTDNLPTIRVLLQSLNRNADQVTSAAEAARPLDALVELVWMRDAVDALELRVVQQARESGASWDEVGRALHVTRQAAHHKFAGRCA